MKAHSSKDIEFFKLDLEKYIKKLRVRKIHLVWIGLKVDRCQQKQSKIFKELFVANIKVPSMSKLLQDHLHPRLHIKKLETETREMEQVGDVRRG